MPRRRRYFLNIHSLLSCVGAEPTAPVGGRPRGAIGDKPSVGPGHTGDLWVRDPLWVWFCLYSGVIFSGDVRLVGVKYVLFCCRVHFCHQNHLSGECFDAMIPADGKGWKFRERSAYRRSGSAAAIREQAYFVALAQG